MLREAYIAGFRTVIATSHYLEGKYIANRQQKERYIQLLQEILIKEKINFVMAQRYITLLIHYL